MVRKPLTRSYPPILLGAMLPVDTWKYSVILSCPSNPSVQGVEEETSSLCPSPVFLHHSVPLRPWRHGQDAFSVASSSPSWQSARHRSWSALRSLYSFKEERQNQEVIVHPSEKLTGDVGSVLSRLKTSILAFGSEG